jgi:hypothetical protein
MRFSKTVKSQKHPFVDEQIRAKAYQISQKYRQNSPEENLKAAIKALEIERFFQPLRTVWQWSGIGEKKGWDFLQLLIVPIVLAVAGNNLQDFAKQRERNQQIIDKKREQEAATEKALSGAEKSSTLRHVVMKSFRML